jgi:subtilisin family serine protease
MNSRTIAVLLSVLMLSGPYLVFADEVATSSDPVLTTEEPLLEEATTTPEVVATTTPIEEPAAEAAPEEAPDPDSYIPGEVLVKYEGDDAPVVVKTDEETPIQDAVADIEDHAGVEYAEPNFVRSIETFDSTMDTYADYLWGLSAIHAPDTWASTTGDGIIVAVIDTGIDYTHPDLAGHMWSDPACVDENGTAIIGGCTNGWDFVSNDNDPIAETGQSSYHGTHVAGTIAAAMGNQVGIAGVAPNVRIMALRTIGNDGSGTVANEARAIEFAKQNGAKIINASFSGSGASDTEKNAIKDFEDAGGLFITAAGNGGTGGEGDDLDALPFTMSGDTKVYASTSPQSFPAQYDLPNIISVTATDEHDALASFSNFGAISVDLGAPGVNILSTIPNDGGNFYEFLSGTSMAVPHVAGTAALLEAFRPTLSAAEVKDLILSTGDPVASLAGKTVSGKRLNALNALIAADTLTGDHTPPVITLLGDNPYHISLGSTFTEPGATATDAVDGDVTARIVITGSVNTLSRATYTRTYVVSDAAGNTATTTRDVIVEDNAPSTSSTGGGGGHHGGGGGGGGGSSNELRFPQTGTVLGASITMTDAQRLQLIALLMAQLQLLQAELAALLASQA